jgi:hypothetical protein
MILDSLKGINRIQIMTTLTKSQEWKLDKIRKESNFLWMNTTLGDEVFIM